MSNRRFFFSELKRRHVWRAALIYAAAVWALAQGIAQLSPVFGLSAKVTLWFVIACAIGFPFWLAFAWYFKFTPGGIARESEADKDDAATRRTGRKLDYWIIGILVIAVVLLLTNQLILQRGKTLHEFAATDASSAATIIPAKSIAVLPFENLSDDKKNEYFVEGMQDLILTKLADIGDLKVISRTSTEKYASHPTDLKTIGQQLGVATILEGSVQKQGDEVLINVQLIDTNTDAHLWAKAYTRKLDNIFSVEGEVAGKVAAALKAKLSPAETTRLASTPTQNPQALNLFLRAQYQFNQGLAGANLAVQMKPALPLYRAAVAADPGFALAWARLSYAESMTAWYGGGGLSVPKLEAAARHDAAQAQRLAPDAAATQLALGFIAYYGQGDFAAALKAFRAVLAARPNDTEAMAAVGYVLRRQHRYKDAIAMFRRALVLDPRNADLTFKLARTYVGTHRYAQSLAPLQRAIALDPGATFYRNEYAWAIACGTGDLLRALTAAQGDAPTLKSMRVQILTWQRQYAAAIALLQGIPDTPDNFGVSGGTSPKALQLADLYRLAGDTAHAQPLYAKARTQIEAQLKAQAGNAQNLALVWSNFADAELGLGDRKAAFAAAAQSLKLAADLKAANKRSNLQVFAGQVYAQAGRADLAVPQLAKVLAAPDSGDLFAPVLLRLTPQFDPIRHDPRFQALLKQYPAPATSVAAAAE